MKKLIMSTALACFSLLPALTQAETLAERCELGSHCAVPANDGGITYYDITPTSGTQYTCEISANKGNLLVLVYGGKDFNLRGSFEFHKADPNVTFDVSGTFKDATNPEDVGQIKIKSLSKEATGTVYCHIK